MLETPRETKNMQFQWRDPSTWGLVFVFFSLVSFLVSREFGLDFWGRSSENLENTRNSQKRRAKLSALWAWNCLGGVCHFLGRIAILETEKGIPTRCRTWACSSDSPTAMQRISRNPKNKRNTIVDPMPPQRPQHLGPDFALLAFGVLSSCVLVF